MGGKQNLYFELHGISAHVDHRSHKEQGLDLIPAIHEGKAVTAIERQKKAEYEQKIARGEQAVLKHTEIRELNNIIREHNHEIRIITEMKKLREQMEAIITPVRERIEKLELKFAEKLERLRDEIISLTVRINRAVKLKAGADGQISSNQSYIKDLAPSGEVSIRRLHIERKALQKELDAATGLLFAKKREELNEKIEALESEITILNENRKYAIKAKKVIGKLQAMSETAEIQIQQMQNKRNQKVNEYFSVEAQIPRAKRLSVYMERLSIRPEIEKEYMGQAVSEFRHEADRIDQKMNCTRSDLLQDPSPEPIKYKYKFTSDWNEFIP